MTTSTSPASIPSTLASDDESAVAVHSCSRLGRRANPPKRSFTDWFWPRRRR
jgi:hypothetical protein